MEKLKLDDVLKYVEENIGIFHEKRLSSLDKLKLSCLPKNLSMNFVLKTVR